MAELIVNDLFLFIPIKIVCYSMKFVSGVPVSVKSYCAVNEFLKYDYMFSCIPSIMILKNLSNR